MSLLVWLPLHGDLTNYGSSPAKFSLVNSSSALSVGTTGKTSNSCYQRTKINTADYITSDINFNMSGDFTMACWCKVTQVANTDTANGIITNHGHTTGGAGITLKSVNATTCYMSCNTGTTSSNRTYHTYYGTTNIFGAWHHLCLTYDRSATKYRLYVDGVCEKEFTYGDTAAARPFRLFDWSTDHSSNASYRPNCLLNDVRLYDHCLSKKEVKLLSQGLVAHYKLSAGGNNNLLKNTSNPSTTSGLVSVPSTCSIVYDDVLERNVFQSSTTATGETYIYSTRTAQVSQSTAYTFSCDIWVNDYVKNVDFFWLSDTASNVKTGSGYVNVTSTSGKKFTANTWVHTSWTFTTKADDYTGYIRIDNNGSSTSGTAAIMKITNLKLEKGSIDSTYTPNASETGFTVGDDCSGYGHHGGVVGDIQLSASTGGRHGIVANFTSSEYIVCGRGPMVRDELTVNWWGYMNDWSLYGSAPMRALSCTEGGGWNFEPSSSKMAFACGTGESANAYKSVTSKVAFSSLKAGWHMFTGTWDGLASRIYIDGVLSNTNSAYTAKTPMFYNANNGIFIGAEAGGNATTPAGPYFTGQISDVRIYCSALSDNDILALYNMASSATKNNDFFAYDFIEENDISKVQITKSGVLKTADVSEIGYIGGMKVKVLSDSSVWARIHWLNVTTNKTWFANASEVAFCDESNRFSRMGLVEHFLQNNNKYEFMLTYPSLSSTLYNRWTQTSSPNASAVTGFTAVTTAWSAHNAGIRKHGSNNVYDCDSGSTWYAPIGQTATWTDTQYIPAANGSSQTETELWVRIDNLPDITKISMLDKEYLQALNIYEI